MIYLQQISSRKKGHAHNDVCFISGPPGSSGHQAQNVTVPSRPGKIVVRERTGYAGRPADSARSVSADIVERGPLGWRILDRNRGQA